MSTQVKWHNDNKSLSVLTETPLSGYHRRTTFTMTDEGLTIEAAAHVRHLNKDEAIALRNYLNTMLRKDD